MDRKGKRHAGHKTDGLSITSLLRKIIKAGVYSKEIMIPATSALIVLFILLWLDEIFDFPRLLFTSATTPFNWQEAVLESLIVLAVWLVALSIIFRNIYLRQEAERELLESERLIKEVINFLPDPTFAIDIKGNIIVWNRAIEEMSGIKSQNMLGKGNYEYSLPFYQTRRPLLIDLALKYNDGTAKYYSFIRKENDCLIVDSVDLVINGQKRTLWAKASKIFDLNNNIVGAIESVRDITERKHMQEELLKAKKLEAIGVLAGGMAHDFNNLLSVILGNIDYAKMYVTPGSLIDRCLSDALEASTRSSELARLLLTFSKGGNPIKETGSLRKTMQNIKQNFSSDSNKRVEVSLPDDLWPANFDELQINQVMYSLISNAKEAIKEEGVIRIMAENIIITPLNQYQISAGKYVKVSVEDNGIGIPEEIIENIFDPYFSSKDMGNQKGMGMSLSICYSIIKKHRGNIGVRSRVGTGTTFYFFLPASENISVQKQDSADTF